MPLYEHLESVVVAQPGVRVSPTPSCLYLTLNSEIRFLSYPSKFIGSPDFREVVLSVA